MGSSASVWVLYVANTSAAYAEVHQGNPGCGAATPTAKPQPPQQRAGSDQRNIRCGCRDARSWGGAKPSCFLVNPTGTRLCGLDVLVTEGTNGERMDAAEISAWCERAPPRVNNTSPLRGLSYPRFLRRPLNPSKKYCTGTSSVIAS
jgi:hypothetical protein